MSVIIVIVHAEVGEAFAIFKQITHPSSCLIVPKSKKLTLVNKRRDIRGRHKENGVFHWSPGNECVGLWYGPHDMIWSSVLDDERFSMSGIWIAFSKLTDSSTNI